MLEGFTAASEPLLYVDLRDVWHSYCHSPLSQVGWCNHVDLSCFTQASRGAKSLKSSVLAQENVEAQDFLFGLLAVSLLAASQWLL